MAQSAICPGNQQLFEGNGDHYLRCVFTVYWSDSPPSTEIFYLTNHPLRLSVTGVSALEDDVMGLLRLYYGYTRVLRVIFLNYSGVEMTPEQAQEQGWYVINGPCGLDTDASTS